MLKFFQIATPDDDPDNWRSKKEEAEQEAEMAIVRPIITKIDDHVKTYLNANLSRTRNAFASQKMNGGE